MESHTQGKQLAPAGRQVPPLRLAEICDSQGQRHDGVAEMIRAALLETVSRAPRGRVD